MQYLFIGLALSFGLIAFGALCLSIFSYMRLNGHMELVVRILHNNNKELSTVRNTVDAVLVQNQKASEQNKIANDHQRVLLASLNRQLIKLDEIFTNQVVEVPVAPMAAREEFNPIAAAHQQELDRQAAVRAQAASQRVATPRSTAHQVAANSQTFARQRAVERPSPAVQAAQQLADRKHKPLDSLVNRIADVEPTGARIPLAQRIRINAGANAQNERYEPKETPKTGPVIRTRETIDVLKMKERRVANG